MVWEEHAKCYHCITHRFSWSECKAFVLSAIEKRTQRKSNSHKREILNKFLSKEQNINITEYICKRHENHISAITFFVFASVPIKILLKLAAQILHAHTHTQDSLPKRAKANNAQRKKKTEQQRRAEVFFCNFKKEMARCPSRFWLPYFRGLRLVSIFPWIFLSFARWVEIFDLDTKNIACFVDRTLK